MVDTAALIDALPIPVVVIGSDGRISAMNGLAVSLLAADLRGWPHEVALRQPAMLAAIAGCFETNERGQVDYTNNDGARDTLWDVSITAADGTVVLSFRDTTAISDADEKRRDFVANVSHELRTPLTSLMGFIETLRGPAKDDPAARDRFTQIMETEAGRMHRLVEDLLSLSHVEDLERIKPTEAVDLAPLAAEALAALEPVAAQSNVKLVLEKPQHAVTILGDPHQLTQVLRNLVENAIKYGGADHSVTVRLTGGDNQAVRLSVLDQGDGIAAHHIARLTERFFRIDSHRGREIGGTGLGLAITKHIITRHRARLRITSVLGQGSEFTVIFPTSMA